MALLIDLSVKWAVVAMLALAITRRVTPSSAAAAHRLWLGVLVTPVFWALGTVSVEPAAYVRLRNGALPDPARALDDAAFWGIVLYAAIALLMLGRVAIGIIAIRRFIGRARPVTRAELLHLRSIAACSRLRVVESDIEIPVTAGFLRSSVVLPANWRALSPSALAAVLRHEAAHVRRKDCLRALLSAVVEAVFWLHPAAWIASAKARRTAELAADHAAAGTLDYQEYAHELLALASGWSRMPPRYALMAGAETNVAWRIRLLLDEAERGVDRKPLLWVAIALLAVATPLSAIVRVGGVTPSGSRMPMHTPHAHVHGH